MVMCAGTRLLDVLLVYWSLFSSWCVISFIGLCCVISFIGLCCVVNMLVLCVPCVRHIRSAEVVPLCGI